MPELTTAPAVATGGSSSGPGSSGTSTGDDSGSGKIDFLFVISRAGSMQSTSADAADEEHSSKLI